MLVPALVVAIVLPAAAGSAAEGAGPAPAPCRVEPMPRGGRTSGPVLLAGIAALAAGGARSRAA